MHLILRFRTLYFKQNICIYVFIRIHVDFQVAFSSMLNSEKIASIAINNVYAFIVTVHGLKKVGSGNVQATDLWYIL